MTKVTKENIAKGDEVFVVQHYADGIPPKRIRARVIEVVRKACRVRFVEPDKTGLKGERMIRFSELERVEPEGMVPPKLRNVFPKLVHAAASSVATSEPEPSREPEPREPRAEPSRASEPIDDALRAWLDMGRELVQPLLDELASLEAEEQVLHEERTEIDRALDANAERRRALRAQVKKLQAVVQATK